MSYWSGEKLIQNKSVVTDFDIQQVDANAYNLRMGKCYFRTADGADEAAQTKTLLADRQPFIIPTGQFAFLLTSETVNVPANAMAFISMRTGVKFKGLINVSGFHVDPGYSGKLVYAVFNASPLPIHLCEGDPIFKIWFADIDRESSPSYLFKGSSQNDISNDLIRGMGKEIYSLQALAENMRDLKRDVDLELAKQKPAVDNLTFVWRAVVLGVVGAIIISVLALAWPSLIAGGYWISSKLSEKAAPPKSP
jgi:dCTP deaminase